MRYQNNTLLDVLNGIPVEGPPIWLMRQAGRVLPEYRNIRSKLSDFKSLVKNPELAAEVTVQPVDILGVDAAIIFSDILVVPEAMGFDYQMIEAKGPIFPKVLTGQKSVDLLEFDKNIISSRLDYVCQAIAITKIKLDQRVPLIGFAGAPWTIFAYLVEGQGSKTFSKPRALLYNNPTLVHEALSRITEATIAYLQCQIKAGADVIQIFDSWAGVLNKSLYDEFCLPYLKKIADSLTVPSIIFAKDAWFALEGIKTSGFNCIGLDWSIEPTFAKKELGDYTITQGNADPCLLFAHKEQIQLSVTKMIKQFGRNHIVNLGHGLYPDTPLEGVKSFISATKNFKYE